MNAKWDSNVGYAWWLMESYWVTIANAYIDTLNPILAYPSISKIPPEVETSPLSIHEVNFAQFGYKTLYRQLQFICSHKVQYLYLTDSPARHWCYLFFRLCGVRRIAVHDHTPGLRTKPNGFKMILKKSAARIPLINADILIGATDFVRNRLIHIFCAPAEKCFTVPNGIRPSKGKWLSPHEAFGIDNSVPIIVTVARANRYKGADFALKALALVNKHRPDLAWHYLFIGDGPDKDAFSNEAKQLGLIDNVTFPGKVENANRYLSGCAIAFHPSKGEVGYSLAILEYMQASLPVVVPNNPSVCEAVQDNISGKLYIESNHQSAAKALISYLDNSNMRKEHGEAALRVVNTDYLLSVSHKVLIEVVGLRLLGEIGK